MRVLEGIRLDKPWPKARKCAQTRLNLLVFIEDCSLRTLTYQVGVQSGSRIMHSNIQTRRRLAVRCTIARGYHVVSWTNQRQSVCTYSYHQLPFAGVTTSQNFVCEYKMFEEVISYHLRITVILKMEKQGVTH